jgi:hypothetical protein
MAFPELGSALNVLQHDPEIINIPAKRGKAEESAIDV